MTIEITGKPIISYDAPVIQFNIKDKKQALKAISGMNESKKYVLEIKEDKPKRSLNANSYSWVVIGQIAEKLGLSNQDVYEEALRKYSKAHTYMIVKPNEVERIIATLRAGHIYAHDIGQATVNGKEGIQLQLFYGSSTFDTKEMSRLIDGIVSDAKELGISTETPEQIARYKEEWKK